MREDASQGAERVRAAEVIGALCLATDLAIGLPLEHGLQSTLFAMRLGERLGIDAETASQTYYACLLFYVGCTADAEISAEMFPDEGALIRHFNPVMFGSPIETMAGTVRALVDRDGPPLVRAVSVARRLPKLARGRRSHLAAICEVAQMLTVQLGLPASVQGLFTHLTERWDGKGEPGLARRDQIPLPVRIVHVARDAAFQRMLGGEQFAVRIVRERAGHAFDPAIATLLADEAPKILALDAEASAWPETMDREPSPARILEGEAIDRALAAMGNFADLASPYLVDHSVGVTALATAAAKRCRIEAGDVVKIRRAAMVHDLGRVAVPTRIWQKAAPLTPDEWERVRLHAYHTERALMHSPMLAAIARIAGAHHERLDGSGYHRGSRAAELTPAARLLAAADAYHAMTEPRPHREPLASSQAAEILGQDARAGRLDVDAASAVIDVAGQSVKRIERPAGLTEREAQVVGLLARGLLTKQVARVLGISAKTADRHIQNAYAKIGVSTRAAAAVFAMQHGLAAWGELPIARLADRT